MAKMVIGLLSGGYERLTFTGVLVSGAAADDMDIEVYVHLKAAQWFVKGHENNYLYLSEDNERLEECLEKLKKVNSPSWLEYFEMAKEMTNMKVYVCSLAGKIWGGADMENFTEMVDGIIGIGEYIDAAKDADVHFVV
ncbi:MAG: DsrE family protein [Bacteroidales bacterium]